MVTGLTVSNVSEFELPVDIFITVGSDNYYIAKGVRIAPGEQKRLTGMKDGLGRGRHSQVRRTCRSRKYKHEDIRGLALCLRRRLMTIQLFKEVDAPTTDFPAPQERTLIAFVSMLQTGI